MCGHLLWDGNKLYLLFVGESQCLGYLSPSTRMFLLIFVVVRELLCL